MALPALAISLAPLSESFKTSLKSPCILGLTTSTKAPFSFNADTASLMVFIVAESLPSLSLAIIIFSPLLGA